MKIDDEMIVSALLCSATNAQAATNLGISERQLYERMKRDSFQKLYKSAKTRIYDTTLERVQRSLIKSVETMVMIMDDSENSPQVRLRAATELQNTALKLSSLATSNQSSWTEYDRYLNGF